MRCSVVLPLPYVILTKRGHNRHKDYKQVIREVWVNLRLLGLNQLWGGKKVEVHNRMACHWECADIHLQRIYQGLLKWDVNLLRLPKCRSQFDDLTKNLKVAYSAQTESVMMCQQLVEASRISLPNRACTIIPLVSLLPPYLQRLYASPEGLVKVSELDWEKAREIKVGLRMPRKQYLKILVRMFALGMVEWRRVSEVRMVNGLQCVRKDDIKLRLIFDGRPVNCVLQEPNKVALPGFHLLNNWGLQRSDVTRFGKIDLDNYYHRLGVPDWLKDFLGLPEVSKEEYKYITGRDTDSDSMGIVCTTLPMGLSHAVFLAQEIHLHLLTSITPVLPINRAVQMQDVLWLLVYIDDVLIGVRGLDELRAKEHVNNIMRIIISKYESVGLAVNQDKVQWGSASITGLGCIIDGPRALFRPTEARLQRLVPATRYALSLEWIARTSLEMLLNHWVWIYLLRRPYFSVFFNIYRLLHTNPETPVVKFWESAKFEFRVILWLAGGICLSWARPRSGWLYSSDASTIGGGACEARLSQSQLSSLSCSELGFFEVSSMVSSLQWNMVFQTRWQYEEHINVLEARALVMCLVRLLTQPVRVGDRWLCATDSMVTLGAVRKGRSSSYRLNNQLRRLLVLCIVADASVDVSWIHTSINPADVLSRVFV